MVTGLYLPTMTLIINGLNAPTKRHTDWMDTKRRPLYKMYTRHPPQAQGHRQTESEGLEKDIPCKQKSKVKINKTLK